MPRGFSADGQSGDTTESHSALRSAGDFQCFLFSVDRSAPCLSTWVVLKHFAAWEFVVLARARDCRPSSDHAELTIEKLRAIPFVSRRRHRCRENTPTFRRQIIRLHQGGFESVEESRFLCPRPVFAQASNNINDAFMYDGKAVAARFHHRRTLRPFARVGVVDFDLGFHSCRQKARANY